MRISKSVMSVGGVVLAAAAIGFTNPKAVHAVTAALVQVTNTPSNPVVTQGVGPQAGNMVHLDCSVYLDGGSGSQCQLLSPDGVLGSGPYSVPVGESLVITSVDVTPTPARQCPYNRQIVVKNLNATIFELVTMSSIGTTHFTYPSGLVIAGGITPTLLGAGETSSQFIGCSINDTVYIFGYLTAS